VYILDKLGGRFVNEVIWRYSSGGGSKRFYSGNHDMIFFYAKSKLYTFNSNAIRVTRTDKSLKRIKTPKGARTNTVDKLPEDIFEIQILNPTSKERIGYPTQKPLALMDRIIKASSKNAYEYVAGLKLKQNIEIKLIKVDEVVPLAEPPHILLSYEWRDIGENHDKEITFTAAGDDVEIWQWDWDYDPAGGFRGEVLMDKTGRQTHVFSGGSHEIAVRGVNKECTNAVEVLHLVVNGRVRGDPLSTVY
jgi:hypothetical protein